MLVSESAYRDTSAYKYRMSFRIVKDKSVDNCPL
jgi:hypothetical protein